MIPENGPRALSIKLMPLSWLSPANTDGIRKLGQHRIDYFSGWPCTVASVVSRERLGLAGPRPPRPAPPLPPCPPLPRPGVAGPRAMYTQLSTRSWLMFRFEWSVLPFGGTRYAWSCAISRISLPIRIGMVPGEILTHISSVPGVWLCGCETDQGSRKTV